MSSSPHDHDHQPPGSLTEVSDGVFAYVQPDGSWWINNTGLLVGRTGAVAIDSCSTERRTRAFLAAVGDVTDRPVRTLVNTHHHGDHTHGNHLFGGATIVGHSRPANRCWRPGSRTSSGSGRPWSGARSSWRPRS